MYVETKDNSHSVTTLHLFPEDRYGVYVITLDDWVEVHFGTKQTGSPYWWELRDRHTVTELYGIIYRHGPEGETVTFQPSNPGTYFILFERCLRKTARRERLTQQIYRFTLTVNAPGT